MLMLMLISYMLMLMRLLIRILDCTDMVVKSKCIRKRDSRAREISSRMDIRGLPRAHAADFRVVGRSNLDTAKNSLKKPA